MSRKILIVDDNAINRQLLVNTLRNDYDIAEAADGETALAMMRRDHKFLSAVLLDILMPGMDGYEVLRRARDNVLLSQIPIIMVTGSEDEESRVKALSLGANDFIQKPFNPDIVRHCLRNNISLRETASILNAIQKDKLTGLYNREAFFERVSSVVKERPAGTYVLSCFDIDNFKLINDRYGAIEGDRLLLEVAKAVRAEAVSVGGIAGRISADNFAVLLPSESKELQSLQHIQTSSYESFKKQVVVFSVGRYLINDVTLSASAIYDRAYIAKQSIKGRYDKHIADFDAAMLEKLILDQQIVSEMGPALASRQFEVWFQPQYNHVTGALIGAEVLTRWRHPQKGIVPPMSFIPLFEQNGFIYEMDKFVWREACACLRKWINEGCTMVPVSVNISRYDIFREDLVDVITGLVNEFDLPINLLHLEITESAFTNSTKLIVSIVRQLVALGFTVEIDDFGSGYSSLNTLKSVPAQVVKLDMRFLEGDDDAQRGGNILESIVRMTKWLGMSIIAEGVETKEQGDFLKSIGCSHVQGYLYAKPMPLADYEKLLKSSVKETKRRILETVDNLDNNTFWNPKSIETLIFNSYVGAACIFEYCDGNMELVRATDKFAHIIGGEGMTVEDVLKIEFLKYMDPSSSVSSIEAVRAAVRKKDEISGEFLFVGLPGCEKEVYLHASLRVIASTGSRSLIYCIAQNITAQRLSERKEKQVSKQLKAVLDNVNCGITAFASLNGKKPDFLFANDKYYEILGYTESQYLSEKSDKIFDWVVSEDKKRVRDTVLDVNLTGDPASIEYRAVRRDGVVVWLRSFISRTSFDGIDGNVILCTYNNITNEKNAHEELLDNLPCGAGICAVSGKDAHMTYLNRRYVTYFKNSPSINRTTSVFDVVHPDDRLKLRNTMRPAFERGGEGTCVIRIKDGDSDYIPFRLSGVSVNSGDERNSIYVTFTPMSYEEQSLSEILPIALETMMAYSSDLTFIKDKNLRYVCCSRAFAKMAGLASEKDVVGKTDHNLFAPSLAESYSADDREILSSGVPIVDKILVIPTLDGETRFSCASKYLLHDSLGQIAGIYGIGRDVTDVRETKSQQQFLINNIPGGVAVYEASGMSAEKIKLRYFSDGFCRLFGFTREEYEKRSESSAIGLIDGEYMPELIAQGERLMSDGTPIDCVYKVNVNGGGKCFIHLKAVAGERTDDRVTVYAVLFDVTKRQEMIERLRVSEEENRLAIRHSGNVVCRYDVKTRALTVSPNANPVYGIDTMLEDVPYGEVKAGRISKATRDAYIAFYESIAAGRESGEVVYERLSSDGWKKIEAHFSTVFSDGKPVSAVLTYKTL